MYGGKGMTFWLLAMICVGTSSILGGVNYITTIVKMRAPGLGWMRLPLTTWAQFITAILQLIATPVLAAALTMLTFERLGFNFFTPGGLFVAGEEKAAVMHSGGAVLLWQHVFWFYSHPAVYILVLPAMGMASDLLSVGARKPIFGYFAMVISMAAIAGLGFIVWAHHMFLSGMNPYLGMAFMVSTMLIALPSSIKVFNWLGTLWRGQIRFDTPTLNAISFVSMFVIGGLSGIFMAATPVDIQIHDTYFIVAHFHYVVFGGSLFAVFGSIFFWFPKMFGRMMNNTLGKIHWFLTFVFFNATFFPMHITGLWGMTRRYADWSFIPQSMDDMQGLNRMITYSAIALGTFVAGSLNHFADEDVYVFDALAGDVVTVRVSAAGYKPQMKIMTQTTGKTWISRTTDEAITFVLEPGEAFQGFATEVVPGLGAPRFG